MSLERKAVPQTAIRIYRRSPFPSHRIPIVDSDDIRQRIRAARALTAPTAEEIEDRPEGRSRNHVGITTDELAARVNEPGLGFKTLGAIERGERGVQRSELIVIAEAMEMPFAFFTLERWQLLEALAGGGAPGIPGATGRRLRDRPPTGEGRQQPETGEGEGRTGEARE